MFLVANVPCKRVEIDKSFLTNNTEAGWTEGYLVSVKSVRKHTLMWEAYIVDQAGLYDKLPTHAIKFFEPEHDLDLDKLEWWNNPSEHITVIEKDFLANSKVLVSFDGAYLEGTYWFTIDFAAPDVNVLNVDWSEYWPEHKSKNIIALDCGHIVAVPNNAMRVVDDSLSPPDVLKNKIYLRRAIDTRYSVEQEGRAYGESEKFFYAQANPDAPTSVGEEV